MKKAFDEVKIATDVSKGKSLIDAISEELK